MVQAAKDTGLSPEQVERIKAAQKRHAAIDPGCEKLTPEEFINWHPVGGISWEERARRMKEKLRKAKIILLNSSGSLGHLPGTIELPFEVARWFAGFLEGTTSNDMYMAETKTYEAKKDSLDNVTFTEIRKGGFESDLVFSSGEIPDVLAEIQDKVKDTERAPVLAVST